MSENFNILEYLDDNIPNIDITRNYIYVLKLVDDRYYVGRTSNIIRRIEEHFTSNGSVYTKTYKPLKVIEIIEELGHEDEKNKTLSYMKQYGFEKVRGYVWHRIKLLKDPSCDENKINNCNYKNVYNKKYEVNEMLKKLYFEENKNIIEIGEILNRSPGSIAWELYNSKLVERIQLTNGYFEYINSDIYNQNKRLKPIRNKSKKSVDINEAKLFKKNIKDILKKNKDVTEIKNKLRMLISNQCLGNRASP